MIPTAKQKPIKIKISSAGVDKPDDADYDPVCTRETMCKCGHKMRDHLLTHKGEAAFVPCKGCGCRCFKKEK